MPPPDPRDPRDRDELELWAIRSPVDPDDGLESAEPDDVAGGSASAEAAAPDERVSGSDPDVVVDLTRLGAIVRSLSDDDLTADEPPAHVWEAIAARTGIAAAARPTGTDPVGVVTEAPGLAEPPTPAGADDSVVTVIEPPEPAVAPPDRPPMRAVPRVPGAPIPFDDAAPRHRARHRRSTRAWALVGAAAAALVVVLVGIVVTRDGGDDETVVASTRLEPLPDEPTGRATPVEARVVETADGRRLDLTLPDGLPAPAGFYEVWLIDSAVEGMVSLGPARADGTYAVPSDLDVAAFPIVDVSVEEPDGDPTHSGVSVLRGTLS